MVEEEGVAEVEEEEEEDEQTSGLESIKCQFVKWKDSCIIVAFKVMQTENLTPLQVALNHEDDCMNK